MEHKVFPEALELATTEVIPKWHEHLANIHVACLAVESLKSKGMVTWAKIKKASPIEFCLSGADVILVVNEEVWRDLTRKQRIALLDHEFCHVTWDQDDGKLAMIGHDLEEFNAVVRRHGSWRDSIELFGEQLELFEDVSALKGLGKTTVSLTHADHVQ